MHKRNTDLDSALSASATAAAAAIAAATEVSAHPMVQLEAWVEGVEERAAAALIYFVGSNQEGGEPMDAADGNMAKVLLLLSSALRSLCAHYALTKRSLCAHCALTMRSLPATLCTAKVVEGDWFRQHTPLEVNGSMKVNGNMYKNHASISVEGDLWVRGEVYKNESLHVTGTIYCTSFYSNKEGSGTVAFHANKANKVHDNSENFDMVRMSGNWFEMGGHLSRVHTSKHSLAHHMFEVAEEALHALSVGSATSLLMCESLQALTGVPLDRPQVGSLLIEHLLRVQSVNSTSIDSTVY
jgi:hypothetical protein